MKSVGAAALASVLFATACGSDEPWTKPEGVSASPGASMATTLEVRWTTAKPSTGYVSYGTSPSLGEATAMETESATSHHATLIGLRTDTVYHYRVITWDGHDAGASEIKTVRTDPLPAALPSFTASGDTTDAGFGDLTLVPVTTTKSSAVALDSEGQIVWYHTDESGRTSTRIRLARDGSGVLYNAMASGDGADSAIVKAPLDGSSSQEISVPGLGQDFLELTDGTLAALASDVRESGGTSVHGDQIVEIDADGTVTPVWSAWDCFDPATDPGDDPSGDWSGASGLSFDPANGTYFVSLRNLSAIVQVSRAAPDCETILGATHPTIDYATGVPAFSHPSGVAFNDNASDLLVMDADGSGDGARVVEYGIDTDSGTATLNWSYEPASAIQLTAPGGVLAITRERRYVAWGNAGRLEVVANDKRLLWALEATPGTTVGYPVTAKTLYKKTGATQ